MEEVETMSDILIAYFSATGTTAYAAKKLAEAIRKLCYLRHLVEVVLEKQQKNFRPVLTGMQNFLKENVKRELFC